MAERIPTLEQQLAFLMKGEQQQQQQQRIRPLTIEQQLASLVEEQQSRSSSLQRSRSIPSDRPLTIEHELASLIEQQQGRRQSFQATSSLADRMPTIEQQVALLFEQQHQQHQQQQGRHDVFQATSSLPERVWTVEQQLACLTRDQQGGYGGFPSMGSPPEGASSIQQQLLARLIREQRADPSFAAAGSIHQSFPSRSNLREEYHSSQLASMEHLHLQLLAQLERGTHMEQAQAIGSTFTGFDQGRAHLGSPPRNRMPIPSTSYGSQESFPGNRYRILVEAERQGSDPILSLAQGAQEHQLIAASSTMNAASSDGFPDRLLSLEHLQLLSQQQHRHQRTLPDTHLPARAGLQANGYSFDNRHHALSPHTPSSTASSGTAIMVPPPFGRHGKSESFPGKLYRLMAHAEMVRDTHIVSFSPDGRSFKIHDPDAFMKDVSPNYFHQSQFLSFVRQLNLYGFERILLGPNFGAYAHPSFIRGRPELLCSIKRKSNTAVSRAKTKPASP
jgi:hypothetical protein